MCPWKSLLPLEQHTKAPCCSLSNTQHIHTHPQASHNNIPVHLNFRPATPLLSLSLSLSLSLPLCLSLCLRTWDGRATLRLPHAGLPFTIIKSHYLDRWHEAKCEGQSDIYWWNSELPICCTQCASYSCQHRQGSGSMMALDMAHL